MRDFLYDCLAFAAMCVGVSSTIIVAATLIAILH